MDLFYIADEINKNTDEKVQKIRDELGLMRYRPRLQRKVELQEQKWIWPCHGKIVGEYGEPRSTHTHNGIDIAVPVGTPVKAIADGTVVAARPADGYGKFVVIEHSLNGQIITSEYGHISKWIVSKNQIVKQGQIIAYSGNEGYSFGPHVHLTIRIGKYKGKAVNPWNYINR